MKSVDGQSQAHHLRITRRKQWWATNGELSTHLGYLLWLCLRFGLLLAKRNTLPILILQVHDDGVHLVCGRVGHPNDETDGGTRVDRRQASDVEGVPADAEGVHLSL